MIKRICGCDCCTCECIDCVEGELTKEDENNFCDKHHYYMGDECPFCKKENQVKDNQLHSPAKPESLVNPQNLKLQSDLNVKSSVFGRQKEESVEPFGNGSTVEAQQTDTGRTLDNKKDEAKKSIKYNKNNNLI